MKIQNLNYQTGCSNIQNKQNAKPIYFAAYPFKQNPDVFVRTIKHLRRVNVKKPTENEIMAGHRKIKGNFDILENLGCGRKLTILGDCMVMSNLTLDALLNVKRDLVLSRGSHFGASAEANIERDLISHGAKIEGDMKIRRRFVADKDTLISGSEINAKTADIVGTADEARFVSKVANIYGLANLRHGTEVVSKKAVLSGSLLDDSKIITKKLELAWGQTGKQSEIYCEELAYSPQRAKFGPFINKEGNKIFEKLEGVIHTEKCSEELLQKYPDLIVIEKPGWYKEFSNQYLNQIDYAV